MKFKDLKNYMVLIQQSSPEFMIVTRKTRDNIYTISLYGRTIEVDPLSLEDFYDYFDDIEELQVNEENKNKLENIIKYLFESKWTNS